MQTDTASGWAVLVTLILIVVGWWWGWRQLSVSAARNQRTGIARWVTCLFGALACSFGAFCVAGVFLMPSSKEGDVAVAVVGGLVLLPFFILWRRNLKAQSPISEKIELEKSISSASPSVVHDFLSQDKQSVDNLSTATKPSNNKKTAKEEKSESILPATLRFAYKDNTGQSLERTVKVSSISEGNGLNYLEGYCHTRQDFRTFRTDRIRGSLVDIESGEILSAKQLLSSVHPRKAMTYKPAPAVTTKKEWQTAVLFTGFTAKRREELEELADAAGWDVRSTVGKTLDYLVTGPRAGPSKIAKAQELGVTVVDEDIFRALV